MGQKHSSAAVSTESQSIQNLSDVSAFARVTVLVTFTYKHTEFVPFVGNHLAATETSNWNDHVDERNIIMVAI